MKELRLFIYFLMAFALTSLVISTTAQANCRKGGMVMLTKPVVGTFKGELINIQKDTMVHITDMRARTASKVTIEFFVPKNKTGKTISALGQITVDQRRLRTVNNVCTI